MSGVNLFSTVGRCACAECWLHEIEGANWDAGEIVASNVDAMTCACMCVNSSRPCGAVDYAVTDRSCFRHENNVGRQPSTCCVRYEYSCNSTYYTLPSVT